MRRRTHRLAADLLDLLAVALVLPLLGGAVTGTAVGALEVTSARWAAAAAPAGAAPAGGPHVLIWPGGGLTAAATADVVATGTLPLGAVVLRLEASDPRDAGAATVTACIGGAWTGPSCQGTAVVLGDLTSAIPVAVGLAPGDRLALRAEARRSAANRSTFTLRVEVPRSAARPGARTAG